MWIYSYNPDSETARDLARALRAKRIKHEKSAFKGGLDKVVINYGATQLPAEVAKSALINKPANIATVSNKLTFFQSMSQGENQPRTVPWTDSVDVVTDWLSEGHYVVAREILNGSSGRGIVLLYGDTEAQTTARLFTRYVKKQSEFRVHIIGGEVIDVAEKKRRKDFEYDDQQSKIRNYDNGWVFARENITVPDDVLQQSLLAMTKSSLDFGAVDIIYNNYHKQAYVLEINSAPGMEGTTLDSYVKGFKQYGN